MKIIPIQLQSTVFSALRINPKEFVQEMRISAAVKWYKLGEISQAKAVEVAGLKRAEFINVELVRVGGLCTLRETSYV